MRKGSPSLDNAASQHGVACVWWKEADAGGVGGGHAWSGGRRAVDGDGGTVRAAALR